MTPQQLDLLAPPRIDRTAAAQVARAAGDAAADVCTAKAKRVSDFDLEAVAHFVHGHLARHGTASGEDITNAAKEVGHRPHDDRAFGAVFATLSRRGEIRCVGYCDRVKGHGTAGGRIWGLVR